MDLSEQVERVVACASCGGHMTAAAWRVVDAEHRLDLLRQIEDKSFGTCTCPHCGSEGLLDEPFLVWQPARTPPLLYVPSTDSTLAQAGHDAMELVESFKDRVDPARRPRSWHVVTAPPALLDEVLRRDVLGDLATVDSGGRIDLSDGRYHLFLGYVRSYLSATALDAAIERFVGAYTWTAAAAVVGDQADELLTDAAEINLTEEITAADARGDPSGVALLREHLEALRRFRRDGMEQVASDGGTMLGPQSELRALLDEIDGSTDDDAEERIGRRERALQLTDKAIEPRLWTRLTAELVTARLESSRDREAELEPAIVDYEAVLATKDSAFDGPQRARVLNNLGIAYADRLQGSRAENIERAIACYEEALELLDREVEPEDWAQAQSNLGVAYRRRIRGDRANNVERALRCYRAALDVYAEQGMTTELSRVRGNLGAAYLHRLTGETSANIQLAARTLNAALRELPLDLRLDRARARHNLGHANLFTYTTRTDGDEDYLTEALACYQAALHVYSRLGMRMQAALVQCSIGSAYRLLPSGDRSANIERAIEAFSAALHVITDEFAPLEWATAQVNLGWAYESRLAGDPDENQARYRQCLTAALTVFTPEAVPAHCRRAAASLGASWAKAEQWAAAAEAYRTALEAADRLYQASLLRSGREAELGEVRGLYAEASYALAQAGELEQAVDAVERGRARSVGDILARDRADLQQVREQAPEAYEQYRSAVAQLAAVESDERSMETGSDDDNDRHELHGRASAATDALARAVARIRRLPGHRGFLASSGLVQIAAALEAGSDGNGGVLAYQTVHRQGSMTLLAYRDGDGRVAVEALPSRDFTNDTLLGLLFEQSNGRVVAGYLPGQLGLTTDLEASLAHALPVLGRALMAPLADRLRALGATHLTLIPGGLLSLFPLHAASYPVADGDACLMDEIDVCYAPSARVLASTWSGLRSRKESPPVLAGVGNPAPHPVPLQFAEAELAEVAALFPEGPLLAGADATKSALFRAAGQATHVHLACHGEFDPGHPLRSALALAGDAGPDLLELGEILASRPFAAARLVVASACQTAISDFTRLPDESVGFPAAFLEAGTPGVVGTLWPVNDLSTALLVTRFYEYHLRGDPEADRPPMAPVQALRSAQRWLRDLTGGGLAAYAATHPRLAEASRDLLPFAAAFPMMRPYRNPYHWAAYLFVGV